MSLDTLQDLFVEQLKDLYSAENQLIQVLPKMARAATTPELRQAFESHLEQTRNHVTRIEEIFAAESLEGTPRGHKCKAMEGLVAEGSEAIEEEGADSVLDAGIIAAAQRVEHYEIAAYGTVRALANVLGYATAEK